MVKIAQIGVGYWGPNLLRNLISNKSCTVRKVADISSERREFVKRMYPFIEVCETGAQIFDDQDIDAVIIATPAESHFELTINALNSGKHVLVEKPMAKSAGEVDQIQNLANSKNLIAMVGHTFLFNSAVRYLKKIIDNFELGDIRYIYSQRLNLGRIRSDVDALWNFAPHDISIIQFLLNEADPIIVHRLGMDYVQDGVDDVVFMNVVYPNKIVTNIHVSWLDPHKIRKMTVVGSKKMVVYDDIAENKIVIYDKGIDRMAILGKNMDFDTPDIFKFNLRSGDILLPKISYEEPLKTEVKHFLSCIIDGTKCISGPEHAKRVIDIICRADKSGKNCQLK